MTVTYVWPVNFHTLSWSSHQLLNRVSSNPAVRFRRCVVATEFLVFRIPREKHWHPAQSAGTNRELEGLVVSAFIKIDVW